MTRLKKLFLVWGFIALTCLLLFLMGPGVRAASTVYRDLGWHDSVRVFTPEAFALRCLFHKECNRDWQFWHELLRHVSVALVIFCGASALAFFVVLFTPVKRKPIKDGGLAAFALSKDTLLFRKETSEGPLMGYIGFDQRGRMLRLPANIRNKHTGVKARSGGGKTGNFILPNIYLDTLEKKHVILVYDIKYPQIKGGLGGTPVVAQRQGLPTYVITPYEDSSYHLPVLDMVTDLRSANVLAEMFYPPGDPGENAFYLGNKRALLSALLLAQAYKGGSIGKVANILLGGKKSYDNFISNYRSGDAVLMQNLKAFLKLSGEDQETVIKDVAKRLSDFCIPNVAKHLGRSEVAALNFRAETALHQPCFIYVGLDNEVIKTEGGKAILRLIRSYFSTLLAREAKNSPGGMLEVPVSNYFDEFTNMPAFASIREDVGAVRSSNTAYHFSLHGKSNGVAVYGQDWEAITDNINTMIYLPQYVPASEREEVAKQLGRTTTRDVSRTRSRNSEYGHQRGITERDVTRALLSLEEMRTWNKYEGVVDVEQSQPILVILPHVREKRVRGIRFRPFGIKNPFYRVYKSVPLTFDLRAWVARLVEIEKLACLQSQPVVASSAHELSAEEQVPTAISESTIGTNVASQLSAFVQGWLQSDGLVELTDKNVFVFRLGSLAQDFAEALKISGLTEGGILKQTAEALTLDGKYLDTLPTKVRRGLLAACQGAVTIPSEQSGTALAEAELQGLEKILPSVSPRQTKVKKIKSLTPQQRTVLEGYLAANPKKVLNHPNGSAEGLTWKACEAKVVGAGVVQLKLATFANLFKIPPNTVQKRTLEGEVFVEVRF
jgi:type IV secretory pathway TraG/TraD family ATPase VirD4